MLCCLNKYKLLIIKNLNKLFFKPMIINDLYYLCNKPDSYARIGLHLHKSAIFSEKSAR